MRNIEGGLHRRSPEEHQEMLDKIHEAREKDKLLKKSRKDTEQIEDISRQTVSEPEEGTEIRPDNVTPIVSKRSTEDEWHYHKNLEESQVGRLPLWGGRTDMMELYRKHRMADKEREDIA